MTKGKMLVICRTFTPEGTEVDHVFMVKEGTLEVRFLHQETPALPFKSITGYTLKIEGHGVPSSHPHEFPVFTAAECRKRALNAAMEVAHRTRKQFAWQLVNALGAEAAEDILNRMAH